uniref:Uncharacterized protein n=1 Tax=Octopus bimaculoides TaxID=37653 RepID=A0A0L8G0A7_OCTBM
MVQLFQELRITRPSHSINFHNTVSERISKEYGSLLHFNEGIERHILMILCWVIKGVRCQPLS